MKILTIGGNHPRHLFYVNVINEYFSVSASIIECRENILPEPPIGIDTQDKENFVKHFKNRDATEKKYFGNPTQLPVESLEINASELNSKKTVEFLKGINPDIVLIFGCKLIKEPLFSMLPKHTVNLHLGISPRYRGAATLFWPFYFMEPNYAGSTFHFIVSEPDAGDVIHQVLPKLEMNDRIHDVACKTIVKSAYESVKLLEMLDKGYEWKTFIQKGTGKNFLESDFKPEHLRVIYSVFNDDIVNYYLQGKLKCKEPKLLSQF